MNIKKDLPALILSGLLSGPASADMIVNLMDLPAEGELVAAGGAAISSSVEYKMTGLATGGSSGAVGQVSVSPDRGTEWEGKYVALSGSYGMSASAGVFAGGVFPIDAEDSLSNNKIDGQDYVIGGYNSSFKIMDNVATIAYGQYRLVRRKISQGIQKNAMDGSEITLGLIAVRGKSSGLRLYAGPEYVVSSEIETKSFDDEAVKIKYERENRFGLRIGFSKPLKNAGMHLFGTAALMHEQSFFIGVSTSL